MQPFVQPRIPHFLTSIPPTKISWSPLVRPQTPFAWDPSLCMCFGSVRKTHVSDVVLRTVRNLAFLCIMHRLFIFATTCRQTPLQRTVCRVRTTSYSVSRTIKSLLSIHRSEHLVQPVSEPVWVFPLNPMTKHVICHFLVGHSTLVNSKWL